MKNNVFKRELKPIICRNCKTEVGRTDGCDLYLSGVKFPLEPRKVSFDCPACRRIIHWRRREREEQLWIKKQAKPPPRNIMEKKQRMNEILELRRELMQQWFTNHAEHCGVNLAPPFPHVGDCQWTIPPVIAALSPNEVYLLLLEASGESFELRWRVLEC